MHNLPSMQLQDKFWNDRVEVTRKETLPAVYKHLKKTGQWDSFKLKWQPGDPNTPRSARDSDTAKFLHGLCNALRHMSQNDGCREQFQAWLDDGIGLVEYAQQPNGYINVYHTVVEPTMRWTNVTWQHELYCAGHFIEAAVAHYDYCGSYRFVDIMCRFVDHINDTFGPEDGKLHGYPGHPEIELALVELYRIRPNPIYLQLARYFVEQRGYNHGEFFVEEAKVRKARHPDKKTEEEVRPQPLRELQATDTIRDLQSLRGHSVRALYYVAGAQGVANQVNDDSLHAAVERLWRNMVDKKLYIHGGVGAVHVWEGFGEDYELPLDSYAETCASISILILGKQMLRHHFRGEVANVMERALYNDVLCGMSLDGRSFFYNQPLVAKDYGRTNWFHTSCCITNIPRFLNSLEAYIFTEVSDTIAINLYIGATLRGAGVEVSVSTEYPWEGSVCVAVSSDKPKEIAIRIPPSKYKCSIAGKERDGYIFFSSRKWSQSITLDFTVSAHIVHPNPKVEATKSKLAVERGPFVYALEQCDTKLPLDEVKLSRDATFAEKTITINGVPVVALTTLVNGRPIQMVPYFTWGNRRPKEAMKVWIDEA